MRERMSREEKGAVMNGRCRCIFNEFIRKQYYYELWIQISTECYSLNLLHRLSPIPLSLFHSISPSFSISLPYIEVILTNTQFHFSQFHGSSKSVQNVANTRICSPNWQNEVRGYFVVGKNHHKMFVGDERKLTRYTTQVIIIILLD